MINNSSSWTYKKKTSKPLSKEEYDKMVAAIIQTMSTQTKPFAEDSEEEKAGRRKRAKNDYEWFCHNYLPHYFKKPFGQIHYELSAYADTGGKSINAVAYPREHGKSTHASFAKVLWKALCNLSPYSIIVSYTEDLTEENIIRIKLECEENLRLKQDFGDLKTPGHWEKTDIVVCGNRIRGRGWTQPIRGTTWRNHRVFYIVTDDLETDEHVDNKDIVQAQVDWILGAAYGSLDDDGTFLMIGTMLDKDCALSRVIKHINENKEKIQKEFGIKAMNAAVYSAIIDENTPNERACWPEGKSLEKLKFIRAMVTPKIWANEFQNMPLDTGMYKLEWLQGFDKDVMLSIPVKWLYFSGSDPSARADERNDFKVHVIIALNPETKRRYVVDAWVRHAELNEFYLQYVEYYKIYRMLRSGFEINGFQLLCKIEIEKLCRENNFWPSFVELHHSQEKFARCSRWTGMAQRGDILFSNDNPDIKIVIFQLNHLGERGQHDDGADGLDMSIEVSLDWNGDFEFQSSGKRASGSSGYGGYEEEGFRSNRRAAAFVRGEFL